MIAIRVNPEPAALVVPEVVLAPNIRSLALVVAAVFPEVAAVVELVAPVVLSTVQDVPLVEANSDIRTSGNEVDCPIVTVTVFALAEQAAILDL